MIRIKTHILKVKLPFYPPCKVKYGLQIGCQQCSLFLGEQTSCLPEGNEVAAATCEVQMQSMVEGVGLCNIKKPSTWTRLARMDVGLVGRLKEGAKSFWERDKRWLC